MASEALAGISNLIPTSWRASTEAYSTDRVYHQQEEGEIVFLAFKPSFSENDWFAPENESPFGETKMKRDQFPCMRSIDDDIDATVNDAFLKNLQVLISPRTSFCDYVNMVVSIGKSQRIVFTGHSSGGATAILATVWYLETYFKKQSGFPEPLCVTFGAPLVGDIVFKHALGRENWSRFFVNFVTRFDIVPRIMLTRKASIKQALPHALCQLDPRASIQENDQSLAGFYTTVLKDTETVALQAVCKLIGNGEPFLKTFSSFLKLSPYRPAGIFVFSTGTGLVPVNNSDAILQILFYASQSSNKQELSLAPYQSIRDHHIHSYGEMVHSMGMKLLTQVHLHHLPLDGGESALSDLGLSTKARQCVHAAFEAEKKRVDNQIKIDTKQPKIVENLVWIEEEYKPRCRTYKNGYYDSFKDSNEEKDFKANVKRTELAGIYDEVLGLVKDGQLPDGFAGRRGWINLATRYRRLIEPLDIANYHRHLKKEDTGPYMGTGRPDRYKHAQRVYEHELLKAGKSAKEIKGSGCGSCFWAEVEELKGKEYEKVETRVKKLEWMLEGWIRDDEVDAEEIYLEGSTFRKWWHSLPEEHKRTSPLQMRMDYKGITKKEKCQLPDGFEGRLFPMCVQGGEMLYRKSRRGDFFLGEVNTDATSISHNSIENKRVGPEKEENKHGKVSQSSTMATYDKHTSQHQVFINFWGEEVRFSFISHLVYALSTRGVNVFIEKNEKRSGDLGRNFQIIEDSNIALVVFSSRYTESRWCLDELVKIKERMDERKLLIIPIFYKVESAQVKQLEGDFGRKLWNLWRIHRDHHIIKWKDALESVSTRMGFCLKDHSSESEFVNLIAEQVLSRILLQESENSSFLPSTGRGKTSKLSTGKGEKHEGFLPKCHLFGLEQHMKQLEHKLEFDCNETRIIGVAGMTGIGKTTLAMMLHEKWNCKFVRCVPLLGIGKKLKDYRLTWLRKTFLEVLLGGNIQVINDEPTHESLKDKLLQTKVFVVLDDVSNKKQLKFLLGDLNWIKKGSKIVITSCDKSLIKGFVQDTYVVPPLNYGEALELFSYHAFGGQVIHPTVTSMKQCKELVDCAGGNPLVIKLLGKKFHGRDEAQWEMRQGDMTYFGLVILDIFRFHCGGLSEKQKDVFLDIASFFRSEDYNFVRSLLDSGDHESTDAESEVRDLTHKGMIAISGCRVEMHDLIYMFGQIYSSQALIEENGGKSRLQYTPEIIDALINQKDTKSIRGIFLDMFEVTEGMVLDKLTFINMPNLRYLKIYDSCCPRPCKAVCKLHFPDGLEFSLEKVRYLHWVKFPLEELPPDFRPKNLVDLRLPYSMIERVWEGVKYTPRLKWVDLSHSRKLFNLSALSKVKTLQRLNLEGCTNLDEVPGEMKNMKSLVYLNMRGCIRLVSLPNMNLISLKTLILSDCSNLKVFQVISQSLEVLHLDGTVIKGLPVAIQKLERLVLLNLKNCKMLECIPDGLGKLKLLEELILSGCSKLKNLLDVRHNMKHVQILLLDGIGLDEMPKISCFTGSEGLASVDMVLQPSGSYPSDWPHGFRGVSSLRRLCLSGNDFVSLQNDIGQLYNLTWLDVKQCKKLKSVPMLPPRLQYFDAHGCDLLEKVANPLAFPVLVEHAHAIFNFSNCNKLDQEAHDSIISYTRQRSQLMLGARSRYSGDFAFGALIQTCFQGLEVPKWFTHRSSGSMLEPQLPSQCDTRFTGIALCAVVLFNGYQNKRNRLVVICNCEFKGKDGSSIHFSCTVGGWSELGITPQKMESSHVFIGFTSMLDISKHSGYDEEGCFCTISSLEFQVTDGTEKVVGCEVLQCGFSLVYEREKICWDAKTVVIPERVKNIRDGNSPLDNDIQYQSYLNERLRIMMMRITESKILAPLKSKIKEINRSSNLHNIPPGSYNTKNIQGVKTFNTDLLTERHKDVFLDIACFFRSEDEYFIRSLLDSGDPDSPDAVSEVRDLAKEFMITITDGRVETNDGLYYDLGSPRRLSLCKYKDILDKLMKMKNLEEANNVRGIFLDMSEVMQSIAMERMTFINMRSLRYLKVYESYCPRKGKSDCKIEFPDGLDFPLEEVRYFHWMKFPLDELPSDFRPENIVDLRLPYSKVERLWKGVKDTPRLKWVDLSHSSKLLDFSGLAKALSLQRLNLEGCTNLNELPKEMKNMKSLVYLNMRGCIRLMSLPNINLISLKTLILSDCSNLKEFQVISQSLEVLHLDGTVIKGLPVAIQKLERLVLLNLKNCKMLEYLPNCLGKLKLLEELILSGCSRLKNLPDVRHSMKHVQTLLFDGTGVDEMPDISCFIGSQGQASVDMSFQHFGSYSSPSQWPREVNGVSSLRRLCLSGHDFVSLHNDIGHLYNLTWLDVKQCKKLRSLPMLPPRLEHFNAHGCDSLKSVANPLAIQILTEQIHATFNFSNCNKLDPDATDAIISYTRWKSQLILDALSRYNGGFTLEASIGTCFHGWEVPAWFSHRATGSLLEPKLPPHWCDSRFTGIALCAVILFPGYKHQRNRLSVKCNCELKSEDGSGIRFSCAVGGWNELGNVIESSHVFLGYASKLDIRNLCEDNEERCRQTDASFEFQVTDGTKELEGYEVMKCGFSLVYASDDLQVNSGQHGTNVEVNQDIMTFSWVQDFFGYIFLAFSCVMVFAVLSFSVIVFAPKYYLSFSDFCWPLLARILFFLAFGLFLKQDATRENQSQHRKRRQLI